MCASRHVLVVVSQGAQAGGFVDPEEPSWFAADKAFWLSDTGVSRPRFIVTRHDVRARPLPLAAAGSTRCSSDQWVAAADQMRLAELPQELQPAGGLGPALNKRPDKSLLRVERAGGRWRVTDAASFEVDERDHADRSFKAEVCRDFQLLDAFNVIGATFCLLRINPDNRELFATAPTAAANA